MRNVPRVPLSVAPDGYNKRDEDMFRAQVANEIGRLRQEVDSHARQNSRTSSSASRKYLFLGMARGEQ